MDQRPWVSFCMSTFRRPEYLRTQLTLLLTQTYQNFEIVVSDNDPDNSGERIIRGINDPRIKYFSNGSNLGMISSFNKSIERSQADFIVMVTDDDPVFPEFLSEMNTLVNDNPGYSLYGGFKWSVQKPGDKRIVFKREFISEILNPSKTPWMLWSSCVIRRESLLRINKVPDYGSPHLADHAMIALSGADGGGVIINKKYSSLTSHDSNFSKFNFQYYVNGCKGFYNELEEFSRKNDVDQQTMNIVRKHLYHWFLANIFNLKRYYTVSVPDIGLLAQVNKCAEEILDFEFMKDIRLKYRVKNLIFTIKRDIGLLKKK